MAGDNLHEHIFDAIRDPVVVVDGNGAIHAANAAAVRLFDLTVEPADPARPRPPRVDMDPRRISELVRRRQKLQGVAVLDRSGQETGIVVDVDPAVGADGHSLLHFHAPVGSLERELWTDDAVATVAHEFRNPLFAIRTALDVLSRGDAGELADNQRRFVETVYRSVERLSRIVDGYLDLGRLRAGVLSVDRERHDVRKLITEVASDLRMCYPALASRLDVTISADVHDAFVDPDRIVQVLLNVMHNAARFTPDGKCIFMRLNAAGREVLDDRLRVLPFEVFGEPRFVCIEVEDEGIGMDSDALAHVFERYHAASATDGPTGGAHLGLHISRALVDAHGGWMQMESRLGEGTVVRIFLPADAATARMISRVRCAEERVRRLRSARRQVTVALVVDGTVGDEKELPAWWPDWEMNPSCPDVHGKSAAAWIIRDGITLVVSTGESEAIEEICAHAGVFLTGVGRVEEGMTFSGAVRLAAVRLWESKERRAVRAESGVQAVRE